MTSGQVTLICSSDATFTGYIKSATSTINIQVESGVNLYIAETRVREVLTYLDSYGSMHKTTGRRPQKLICKTGPGHLELLDPSDNRHVTDDSSSGMSVIKIEDTDLTLQINGDGRDPADYVDSNIIFNICHIDGPYKLNESHIYVK